ncbi:MAG TPA: uroporphyrinogen decarboxylase family protein [Armatimonadota bacterium]|nr:uroporphyrinogen decarboxylase family protein [Armatimonadota bacterium]
MTSRDIVIRTLEFTGPARTAYAFAYDHFSDLCGASASATTLTRPPRDLHAEFPDFAGDLWEDEWGNVWGRLDQFSKGESLAGAIRAWSDLDTYRWPDLDNPARYADCAARWAAHPDKYHLAWMAGWAFNICRYLRKFETFLMDIAAEPEQVARLLAMADDLICRQIDCLADAGADGVMVGEDWGTQDRLLISPLAWRDLFKPGIARCCARAHARGLHVWMHSCGCMTAVIPDLIECGVDLLQFDQPALHGIERLGREFGGMVAFWCPVDIQTTMQTGDRATIEAEARALIDRLGRFGGGFVAGEYGSWEAIGVERAWGDWACDAFMAYGGRPA